MKYIILHSISASLKRERTVRSLPTVVRGLAETWPSPTEKDNYVFAHSLITVADSPLARWLSLSDDGELIAHEWDTRVDSETQYSMGHVANDHVCSRMATNGVFIFDPETKVLSFKHSIQRRLYSRKLWYFKDVESSLISVPTFELKVSVDGQYAALWDRRLPRVWLVNVNQKTCHSIGSSSATSFYSPDYFDLCFSPNGLRIAICHIPNQDG